jgi:DNA invertase Pin-like site-specific DNA recombinase
MADILGGDATGSVRAGLYERVSRVTTAAERQRARSIEQQNVGNREACQRYEWGIADIYPDPGLSASRFAGAKGGANREQYRRMVADLAAGRLDVLVMWEPSRGSRELEGWASLLNIARRTGTKIYITSHDRVYDLANARDRRSLAEDGVDSEYEAEKISARIKRGKEAARLAGRPQGKPIYGTRRVFDPQTRQWLRDEADPDTAAVVARIKKMAGDGESYAKIAAALNSDGIPSPGGAAWNAPSVLRIAASPVYGKMDIIGLDREADTRALMRASDATRKGERPARQMFRYSGVMRCAVCGNRMRAANRRTQTYYSCDGGHVYVEVATVDAYIDAAAIERLCRPDLSDLINRTDASASDEAAAQDAIAARGRRKVAEATASYNADRIGIESLEAITKDWEPKIRAAEKRAAQLRMPSALVGLPDSDPAIVTERWQALTISARKAATRALMPDLEVRRPPQAHMRTGEAIELRIIPWPQEH